MKFTIGHRLNIHNSLKKFYENENNRKDQSKRTNFYYQTHPNPVCGFKKGDHTLGGWNKNLKWKNPKGSVTIKKMYEEGKATFGFKKGEENIIHQPEIYEKFLKAVRDPKRNKKISEKLCGRKRPEHSEFMKEQYRTGKKVCPMKDPVIAEKSFRIRIKNLPYIYKNIHFMSKQEIECYKFLEKLDIPFVSQFRVNGGFVDFFVDNLIFWEHHPLGCFVKNENFENYYKQRRKLLDKNGFSNNQLIVTTSLDELNKVNDLIEVRKR